MVEAYLRTTETPVKPLRETVGMAEAAQKVTGPASSMFGFGNETETMRALFEMLRKGLPAGTNSAGPPAVGALPVQMMTQEFKDWVDLSLLPPFEKVAKYFHYSVYGGTATIEGLSLKMFAPAPPGLKR
jgi:hypothetical protein